ncbi:hypothetical protein GE09DRAFT_1174419 [Coniochaeta sp. 2T2.1]|nr:hypothetical protein GE09DRAFT_1174419 [Coniochaeta sp. 2T2.1]
MSATAIVGLVPTILGPLTTVFTPPPACTVAVGQVDGGLLGLGLLGGGPAGNFAFLGQTCNTGQPADATTCWPATSSGAPPAPSPLRGWGVYSPGIECPAGYATACSATAGGTSGWPLQFQLTAGETAVGCCPSGYGCANFGGQTCTMIATSTVIPTVTCDGNKVGALAFNTVPDASVTAFSLYAPMIQINFQSSDLPPAEAPTPSSGPGVVPVPVPGQQPAGTLTTRTTTTVMASTPSPAAPPSSSFQTQTSQQEATSTTATTQPTTLLTAPSPSLLLTAPPLPASDSSAPPSSSSPPSSNNSTTASLASNNSSTSPSSAGFPRMAAVGIGVGGGVAALLIAGSALMYVLRRRRNRLEDENLDRLYGLGKLDLDSATSGSGGGGRGGSDGYSPGFYRGQMPTRPPPVREMHF